MFRSLLFLVTLSLVVQLLVACDAPPIEQDLIDPEAIEVDESALWGDLSFPCCGPNGCVDRNTCRAGETRCSAAEQSRITDAVNWIRFRSNRTEFLECLREAYGVEAEGRMPEAAFEIASTTMDVRFQCQPGTPGLSTWVEDGEEWMNVWGGYALDVDSAQLGAGILHEITHNHRFFHNTFYGPTWPDQVQECIYRLQPHGTRRRDQGGQVYLAPLGGDGGTEDDLGCSHEQAMVGLRGSLNARGEPVEVVPICQKVEGTRTVGATSIRRIFAPAGGSIYQDQCPQNQVITQIWGSADEYVSRIRGVCSPISQLRDVDDLTPATTWLPSRGIYTTSIKRACPGRKSAVGLRARSGSVLDRVELQCDDFPLGRRQSQFHIGGHGGWGGHLSRLTCDGHAALTGIYGQWDPASGLLSSIGGRCRPLNSDAVAIGEGWGEAKHFTEQAGTIVPQEGITRRSNCDAGEVMVGALIGASNIVGEVVAICAEWETWRDGDDTTRLASGFIWQPGQTLVTRKCRTGEVAIGLDVQSGALVDRVGVICAVADAVGTITRVAQAGGNGGQAWEEICPQARPLVGLWTEYDDSHLKALTGQCGRHTADGVSVVDGVRLPTLRGTDAADQYGGCPQGDVMVGVDVGLNGTYVDAVRPLCADEVDLRGGIGPVPHALGWRGDFAPERTERLVCPMGFVVRGLNGQRGNWQDALGLVCGRATLLPGDTARGFVSSGAREVWPVHIPAAFDGRLRIQVNGTRWFQPTVRFRRGAAPTDDLADFEVVGQQGRATIDVRTELGEDLWFLEIESRFGVGFYSVTVELLP